MRLLEYTAESPAADLALDEALLEMAELGQPVGEVLRLWEPRRPFVVVGAGSQVEREVHTASCAARGVPILRRTSGGCAVVGGPGCAMYSLILSLDRRRELRHVDKAHAFVLDRIAAALTRHQAGVQRAGTSDLAVRTEAGLRKFSGNSLRIRRNWLLYHGTILYQFPLELIDICLTMPARQPDYRQGRRHGAFVTNLPLAREVIYQALAEAFEAREPMAEVPVARVAQLAAQKYSQAAWNLRR